MIDLLIHPSIPTSETADFNSKTTDFNFDSSDSGFQSVYSEFQSVDFELHNCDSSSSDSVSLNIVSGFETDSESYSVDSEQNSF